MSARLRLVPAPRRRWVVVARALGPLGPPANDVDPMAMRRDHVLEILAAARTGGRARGEVWADVVAVIDGGAP